MKIPQPSDFTSTQWNNWHWHLQNSINNLKQLGLPGFKSQCLDDSSGTNPFIITPYYLSRIKKFDYRDPVLRQVVSTEINNQQGEDVFLDPLGEKIYSPVPGLIQRYRNRALILLTSSCAVYCRFCTRQWFWQRANIRSRGINIHENVFLYLAEHQEINEIIISGGDPLVLPTPYIAKILERIRTLNHINVIRIATRIPVVLPMRITSNLVTVLKRFKPIWVSTHFNHPNEISPESALACQRLLMAGIPILNQTVLLENVNSDRNVLATLFHELIKFGVKPYYLFQCDPVKGNESYRVPLANGLRIMEWISNNISGIALPKYVLDLPGYSGKVLLTPHVVKMVSEKKWLIKGNDGKVFLYNETPGTLSFQLVNGTTVL